MKLQSLALALFFCLFLSACKKESNAPAAAAFTLDGIQDVVLYSGNIWNAPVMMPLTVSYHNLEQQSVTVTVSGAPSFIFCGVEDINSGLSSSGPWTGFPTFTIPLKIYYDHHNAYVSGVYTITVTATGAVSGTKAFTFKLSAL